MNIQRVTISMPDYLYQKLTAKVASRKISSFVSYVLEKELLSSRQTTQNPIDAFLKLRKGFAKKSNNQILSAIKRGRL